MTPAKPPIDWPQIEAPSANRLRLFCEKHRLSGAELARRLGLPIHPSSRGSKTVQNWMTGKTTPPPFLWRALRDLERELEHRA